MRRHFAGLVESRDAQTYGHCDRVGRNAVAIGRHLGLDRHALGQLYWAGLLHDLGKIGVPEAILRKPGPLTAAEFDEVKKHCAYGHAILLNVSDDFETISTGADARAFVDAVLDPETIGRDLLAAREPWRTRVVN